MTSDYETNAYEIAPTPLLLLNRHLHPYILTHRSTVNLIRIDAEIYSPPAAPGSQSLVKGDKGVQAGALGLLYSEITNPNIRLIRLILSDFFCFSPQACSLLKDINHLRHSDLAIPIHIGFHIDLGC